MRRKSLGEEVEWNDAMIVCVRVHDGVIMHEALKRTSGVEREVGCSLLFACKTTTIVTKTSVVSHTCSEAEL